MAKKLIKAEEEIKEEKDLDIKKDEKDLDKKEEVKEDVKEEVKEDKKDETKTETETETKNLIVLDSGATVDEEVKLSEEEADDLAKITKQDGTEIFVEKVEGDEGEKKEIYEAIIEADTVTDGAEEISDELMNKVNDQEIEEVAYVPAACHTAAASLNNSFYVVKLKSGKIKALKAGKIFNKQLKASILKALKENKELPSETTVFNKIAHKIGYTFGAFTKLASKLNKTVKKIAKKVITTNDTVELNGKEFKVTSSKNGIVTLENGKKLLAKQLVAADIQDTIPGKDNDKAEELKNFSIEDKDIKKDNVKSEIALDSKEFKKADEDASVKAAPSKVKSLYNRLPSKSGVGNDIEWALKDFNKERNKKDKTVAAQIKSLRDATKELRAQKEIIASKEAEIKALKAQLEEVAKKEATAIKASKIKQIIAALNIEDAEEKAAMTEKFAKYSNEQLDAVYETYTCCPAEEATNMHERMINEQMKKEASELAGFVPAVDLKEEISGQEDMEALVLERELASQNK